MTITIGPDEIRSADQWGLPELHYDGGGHDAGYCWVCQCGALSDYDGRHAPYGVNLVNLRNLFHEPDGWVWVDMSRAPVDVRRRHQADYLAMVKRLFPPPPPPSMDDPYFYR